MKIIAKIKLLYFTFTILLQAKIYFIFFSYLNKHRILNYRSHALATVLPSNYFCSWNLNFLDF